MLQHSTIFLHATYVAFVFSVLFFGALAFRQVVDNLELKKVRVGEDLHAVFSGPGVVVIGLASIVCVVMGYGVYSYVSPSVWAYAMPLVVSAQVAQLALRLVFQRTRIRTQGIVVLPLLRKGPLVVPYRSLLSVTVDHQPLWATITLLSSSGSPVTFRIFRLSERIITRVITSASDTAVFTITKKY